MRTRAASIAGNLMRTANAVTWAASGLTGLSGAYGTRSKRYSITDKLTECINSALAELEEKKAHIGAGHPAF